MNEHLVAAVFDSHSEAERAINELRSAGVDNSAISIVAQHEGKNQTTDGAGDRTTDLVSKTAAGAGIGALLGVAALAIPGVGPLVAAGAIAEAAVGGAALTGTMVGAAAGTFSSLLKKHGIPNDDARYFEERVNEGGVFVSVDTQKAGVDASRAKDILYRAGGHSANRAKISGTV